MRKVGKFILITILIALPGAEIAARIIGWGPLRNDDFHVDATPSPWIRGNDGLGFELVPGSFDIVLNQTLRFHATHLPDGTRDVQGNNQSGREIVFMGCSYTYGYGVDDEKTFVSLLQKEHPDWRFRNLAVPGYGTAQALKQLENLIKKKELPEVLVLVHSVAHEERDVFAPSWRKALKIGFTRSNKNVQKYMQGGRFPYYDLNIKKMNTVGWDEAYSNWVGRETFAIVNALQSLSETDTPGKDQAKGSKALVQSLADLCNEHGIQLVVFDLDASTLAKSDLPSSVTFEELNFNFSNRDLINYPVDRHPNEKGHDQLFRQMETVLSPLLHE